MAIFLQYITFNSQCYYYSQYSELQYHKTNRWGILNFNMLQTCKMLNCKQKTPSKIGNNRPHLSVKTDNFDETETSVSSKLSIVILTKVRVFYSPNSHSDALCCCKCRAALSWFAQWMPRDLNALRWFAQWICRLSLRNSCGV